MADSKYGSRPGQFKNVEIVELLVKAGDAVASTRRC